MGSPSTNNVPMVRLFVALVAVVMVSIILVLMPFGATARTEGQTSRPSSAQTSAVRPAASTTSGDICNTSAITIPGFGVASPYPSNIEVTGRSGYVSNVTVKLNGLTHDFYSDMDILLAGPEGQGVILMSDAGSNCLRTTDLTIQDGAPPIPLHGCPASVGTYKPTNYSYFSNDAFPAPAPQPFYDENLSTFNGGNPNGAWSLYVVDNYRNLGGQISGGWCLNITTSDATPAATRTPTITRTSTPATPPLTPTSTPTGGGYWCYAEIVQATASCAAGDTYHYRFVMNLFSECGGGGYVSFTGNVYLEASPDESGPWTTVGQTPRQDYMTWFNHYLIDGDIVEAIPQQYRWYRFRLDGRSGYSQHPISGQTEPMQICSQLPYCPPNWNLKAEYPTTIAAHAITAYGNELYSFGGRADNNYDPLPFAYKFNPAVDAWTTLASLPAARMLASAVSGGGYVYIINGWDGNNDTNTIYRYDPVANTYTSLSPGLLPTSGQAAVYLNGKIYRIGGHIPDGPLPTGATNTVEIYGESFVAPLPIPLEYHVAVALNGYIYVAGGLNGDGGDSLKTYRYDPASNSWNDAIVADLPVTRERAVSAVLDGKWVIMGGIVGGSDNSTSAIAWDPATNTWSSITPMRIESSFAAGAVINDAIYVVGGEASEGLNVANQEYLPAGCVAATATATVTTTPISPTQTPGGPSATTRPTNTVVTVTPSVTPTPSRTVTGTIIIPTPTPGPCVITFSDVPANNTFFTYIHCLACRGIISGYSDGTFRPNNEITRGQIAKIVSNAAGFDEDPDPQIYEDVPIGSPFYDWVNRLSNRGYMGGYDCGLVPEEPCVGPGYRPYFRPNISATRGQLAKITSNAANIQSIPSGLYYTDVPEGHQFYLWVMRLTTYGVMSGYACGGPGEPCDSENRPYFRPYNNVTRGQASKIVANTFFPFCQTP